MRVTLIVAVFFSLTACGEKNPEDRATKESETATDKVGTLPMITGSKTKKTDPCSLLSEATLRELAKIDAATPMEVGGRNLFTHRKCSSAWCISERIFV